MKYFRPRATSNKMLKEKSKMSKIPSVSYDKLEILPMGKFTANKLIPYDSHKLSMMAIFKLNNRRFYTEDKFNRTRA